MDFSNRLLALDKLLLDEVPPLEKIKSLQKLIFGMDTKLDTRLEHFVKVLEGIDKLKKGSLLEVGIESLPDSSPKKKKYKKLLLLLLRSKSELTAEIKRVKLELNKDYPNLDGSATKTLVKGGKIARLAKGPLGIITIAAVALVALEKTSVPIAIQNESCDTIYASEYAKFSLPGFSLPKENIPQGAMGVAKIPNLTYEVTKEGSQLTVKAVGLNMNFTLEDSSLDVLLNGVSVLSGYSKIKFDSSKANTLTVKC